MSVDRAALAARNVALVGRMHRPGRLHRIRQTLLRAVARLPVAPPSTAHPESILLIRPDHVGDVLFTTPALHMLRAAMPDATITALVGPWSASVLTPYAELDHVVTLEYPGFTRKRRAGRLAPYMLAWRTARRLRQWGVGAAVILRPDHWWGALVAHLAAIPARVGYDLPEVAPFLTDRIVFDPYAHSVRLNLKLVERWTGFVDDPDAPLKYPVLDENQAHIDAYLAAQGCAPGDPVVAVHPGSGSTYKTWLPARWAAVADELARRLGARIVLTGSAREAVQAAAIVDRARATRPINAAGDTTLGQLAALYARARLVLGPDSGPLHLAVAVETPTVHLYGPADPARYGPWGPPGRHVALQSRGLRCIPCGILDWSGDDLANHPCVHDISVAQVLSAAEAALEEDL